MAVETKDKHVSLEVLKAALDASVPSGLTYAACKISTIGGADNLAHYSTDAADHLFGGDVTSIAVDADGTGFALPAGVWLVATSFRRSTDASSFASIEPFVLAEPGSSPTKVEVRNLDEAATVVDSWTICIRLG